jgi:putative glutamine amidotransferase
VPPTRRPVVAVSATLVREPGAPTRVRTNAAYARALEAAGVTPLVVPPFADVSHAAAALAVCDGLVLTGGEDVDPARYGARRHPALGAVNADRDATELALVEAARANAVPTLAICRGIQLLNVALGGTLVQDLPSERPSRIVHAADTARDRRSHAVAVVEGSRLAQAIGATHIAANSLHHQALDRVATPLRVSATAPDGVVEGIESADAGWWVLGVQWHPEELTRTPEAWDRGLFAAFADAVRARVAP